MVVDHLVIEPYSLIPHASIIMLEIIMKIIKGKGETTNIIGKTQFSFYLERARY